MNAIQRNLASAALAVAAFLSSASALSITPTTPATATGTQNNTSDILVAIASHLGSSTLLYKQDVGGGEEGALQGSYQTAFFNTPSEPEDATITYVPGSPIVGPTAFLLVKDGSMNPAWYLFNLTGLFWNGMEQLVLMDFWPDGGAISHVSLFGGQQVPDGGMTALMLGTALCALGIVQRRRFA